MPSGRVFEFTYEDEDGCEHSTSVYISRSDVEDVESEDEVYGAVEADIDNAVDNNESSIRKASVYEHEVEYLVDEIKEWMEEEEIGPWDPDRERESSAPPPPPPRTPTPVPARSLTPAEEKQEQEYKRARDFFFGKKRGGGVSGLMGLSSWQPRRRRG